MFWIRADGNAKIGAGHMMRCLTIAEELAGLRRRQDICFVCAEDASANLAAEHGFQTYVLQTDYRKMETELQIWDRLLADSSLGKPEEKQTILVDSYYVTDRYLVALQKRAYVILMDDMGERCYPADCVVNYNAPARLQQYLHLYQEQNVRLLIGSSYTPIRRQFWNRRYQVKEEVRVVLITTGGGDSENIAGKILRRLYNEKMIFYVVTGRFNPNLQKLQELERRCGNVHICHDVKDMAGLMVNCDVAVTAGGSTVYELAAVGVPFVCFSFAENQEALTKYIGEEGIAEDAGAWHRNPEETLDYIEKLFKTLVKDSKKREAASLRETEMIDCGGAVRLAEELNECNKDKQ